jgi:hypothetical protein
MGNNERNAYSRTETIAARTKKKDKKQNIGRSRGIKGCNSET